MTFVLNTNTTGWYRKSWVWKIRITVPAMTKVGFGPPAVTLAPGTDAEVDFFRLDPGDVTIPGFDGNPYQNDAGVYTQSQSWFRSGSPNNFGAIHNLVPGTYTLVAYVYNTDGSLPSGVAPDWGGDFGILLDVTGIAVGATIDSPREPDNAVGIFMAKVDRVAPEWARLIYRYSRAKGLVAVGQFDPTQNTFPSTRFYEDHSEVGAGDYAGHSYLNKDDFVTDDLGGAQAIYEARADGTFVPPFTLFTHQTQMARVPPKPGLLYGLASGEVDRFIAGDTLRYVDTISFSWSRDPGGNDITYGLVDRDDAAILYGTSSGGLFKVDINHDTLTRLATFTANYTDIYAPRFTSNIIDQRANGDIVTSPCTGTTISSQPFGFIHTWDRDGAGLKSEQYLGCHTDWSNFAPIGLALLDDDTVLFSWSKYNKFAWTYNPDRSKYPQGRVEHFYTAPIIPQFEITTYEALPDNARLFSDGTTGWWTTMGRMGNVLVANNAPFFIDPSVRPHDGVGRTICSQVIDWEDNQYVQNLDFFPVLPGDNISFSAWLKPELQSDPDLVFGSRGQVDIINPQGSGSNATFYSIGDGDVLGGDTTLPAGQWTQIVVNGVVPGTFPPGIDPGTDSNVPFTPSVRAGPPGGAKLRLEHPGQLSGGGKLWISDISLTVNGHQQIGFEEVAQLAWTTPSHADTTDSLRFYFAQNGWPMGPFPTLAGASAGNGVRFDSTNQPRPWMRAARTSK